MMEPTDGDIAAVLDVGMATQPTPPHLPGGAKAVRVVLVPWGIVLFAGAAWLAAPPAIFAAAFIVGLAE